MVKRKKSVKKTLKAKTAKVTKSSVKKSTKTKKSGKPSQAIAIVALILNIIILPGLGSLIGGKTKEGVWQLVLVLVGIPLSIILIGIPMIVAGWIWGIVTGVKLIQESQ